MGAEDAAYAAEPQPLDDAVEPADAPPGLGEQPSGERGREDRPGRRRRRGRRGGRRGRDRDDAPREPGDDVAANETEAASGVEAPEDTHAENEHEPAEYTPEHVRPAATDDLPAEPRYEAPERDPAPERSWHAPDRSGGEGRTPRRAEEAAPPVDSPPPAREPEPVHAEPIAEAAQDDPSRPARKGWWQRRFSPE
jgi:ribonuclease E